MSASPSGMAIRDIYYIIFRHKWKILACALAGFAVAAYLYITGVPEFQTEARLFVRYVETDDKPLTPGTSDRKSPDRGGETIMQSEVEILSSADLVQKVVDVVGAKKILAKLGGGDNPAYAVALVMNRLTVVVPRWSTVISIKFSHPDPEIAQLVLRELVNQYLKRHAEVHRQSGMVGDLLSQETDQLHARLSETEDALNKARSRIGVISVEDAKKNYSELMSHLEDQIISARAELAEHATTLAALRHDLPSGAPDGGKAASAAPPKDQLDAYANLNSRLALLRSREPALLSQFTDSNPRVQELRRQIADVSRMKQALEQKYPVLARQMAAPPQAAFQGNQPVPPALDAELESAKVAALEARIKTLEAQLANVRSDAAKLDNAETDILDLTRQRDLYASNYRYYAASLEQERISETFASAKAPNIVQIQAPSPPMLDHAKASKKIAMAGGAGIALGLGWAFLIELYLDRSVRRPIDVDRRLRVPLFLSIPYRRALGRSPRRTRLLQSNANATTAASTSPPSAGTAAGHDDLRPFHETLRDRLISYFDNNNLTHKPKLVAVTGIGAGSGVTTIAAGLAHALSETGDGNVLLVDMTPERGSAQHFYRGAEVCGLDQLLSTRNDAQVHDNLFVVAEDSDRTRLSRAIPQRFSKIIPALRASEFDYIIFDMPPVSQISVTPRLAKFMNMVLLVIESERTDVDLAERAVTLLADSKAHVGAVLNKTRTYVPSRLCPEFAQG